jgi:hypothetical protein
MVAPKQETPNTIYKQNILGIFDLPFYIVGNGIHQISREINLKKCYASTNHGIMSRNMRDRLIDTDYLLSWKCN